MKLSFGDATTEQASTKFAVRGAQFFQRVFGQGEKPAAGPQALPASATLSSKVQFSGKNWLG